MTQHGKYGFRYGGVIYHSDSKKPLRKKRRELAVAYHNKLSVMKKQYPIQTIDTETFEILSMDYETKHLE